VRVQTTHSSTHLDSISFSTTPHNIGVTHTYTHTSHTTTTVNTYNNNFIIIFKSIYITISKITTTTTPFLILSLFPCHLLLFIKNKTYKMIFTLNKNRVIFSSHTYILYSTTKYQCQRSICQFKLQFTCNLSTHILPLYNHYYTVLVHF